MPLLRFVCRAALAGCVAAVFAAAPAAAQSLNFGALAGRVTDADGRPLHDVEVRIVDRASGAERTAQTGRDGRFRFGLLSVAAYDVHAEVLGFRPLVHLGVRVEPGTAPHIRIRLRPATPPVVARDTVQERTVTAAPLTWLVERGYGDVTAGRRLLSDVASLAPMADADGVEGLPWRLAETVIDGARVSGIAHPASAGAETMALAVPMRGVADARAGGVGFDVEMGGTGVGLVGTSSRGGRDATWRGITEGGSAGLGGALALGGTVQRDTAQAIVGGDYQRTAVALPALFGPDDALGLQLADIAATAHGVDLSAHTLEQERIEERWSGFTRFDWLQGDRFALSFRASGSRYALADPSTFAGLSGSLGTRQVATAANASLDLLSRVSARVALEMRLSGDVGETRAEAAGLPYTSFAARGLGVGGAIDEPFTDSRTTPRFTGIVHLDLGAHRVKTGFALTSDRVEYRHTADAEGRFAFGDAVDFATLVGSYRAVSPDVGSASFRLNSSAFFVQDAWAVSEALTLTAGIRIDGFRRPDGEYAGNAAWRAATGLQPEAEAADRKRVAPRVGFRWAFGDDRSWVLEGGAGVFNDAPGRRELAEALALGRGAAVVGALGTLDRWPAAPVAAVPLGQTLTVLGPRFTGPRTQRLAIALQRSLGPWTAYLSGVYRHTDFLARRRDLNLPAVAVGTDQYGRPLYGRLAQAGALVAAEPGSNRRFAGFDAVYALEATGFSDFSAISVGVDRVVDRGVSVAMNYTYAGTTDNVIDDGLARTSAFPSGLDGRDWADGVGDRAAPHRALVAVEWAPAASGALRLGAIYRVRSGTPFTPGFRAGVDANGDGDPANDPAFIDAGLAGMDALLGAHDCLREGVGRFAERNSCRGDLQQRLDLRAALRLNGGPGVRLDLVIEAMDVVAAAAGRIDDALYLVDRTGTLSTNATTGVTSVPLIVNPRFGEILADRSPGVLWRVGLRIGR